MTDLPTGTLTFLFSDIEGSTRLVQELGERWGEALEQHHRLLRSASAEHGGTEVGTEGDSFFVVFPTASSAVAAAATAQRSLAAQAWPGGAEVRVRMGIHTGTATLAGGGYAGLDVHRAARIMSAGHGGQVLLSDVTRSLVTALPAGVGMRDLGEHRLRDLSAVERLHQLVVDGAPSDFPVLRTLAGLSTNLPVQLTSFLGRSRELAEVTALLDDARLLTLTGPGGTGKTRLALQAAARQSERYPDGIWFVALETIRTAELVPEAIAKAMGLSEQGGRPPLERVLDRLRERRTLLVLDNFEQVLDAAPMVTELLKGAGGLRTLVTSRSLLNVHGEHEYPVPPLALPDLQHLPDPDRLSDYEAVALFVERARAAKPGFSLTAESAPAVAEICVRLDGLPLAIELAAARVKLLPPRAILQRLGDRLRLLGGGARDLPERQRTLRGAIEWSYDLLDEADRRLFACVSIFVGGAALDALEAVCDDPGADDVLPGIGSLVDKSLVRQGEGVGGQPRFTMLETIRDFGLQRSAAGGSHGETQRRHAEWFADLVEGLAPSIMGPEQREVLDRLEEEHPNLRAAMAWAIEAQRADLALRIASRLWRMWQMRGYVAAGLDQISRALAMPGASDDPVLRAEALEAAGGLAYWGGDVESTRRWYEEALAARRALGEPAAIAEALYNLSFAFSYVMPAVAAVDVEAARRLGSEALGLFRELGDESGEARTSWMLASVDAVTGDFSEMAEKSARAEAAFRRLGDRFYLGWALWSRGFGWLGTGHLDAARAALHEALEIFSETDDVSGCVTMVEMAAIISARAGDLQRAARLSGGIATAEAGTGLDVGLFPRAVLGFRPEELRDAPETAAAWDEGTRLDLQALIAAARDVLAPG